MVSTDNLKAEPATEQNFYLAPSELYKTSEDGCKALSKFETKRKVWLFNRQLAQQEAKPWSGNSDSPAHFSFDRTSSTSLQKNNAFKRSLTTIMSCIYAVFIVTFGIVVYLGDVLSGKTPFAEIFSLYLVTLGMIYTIFLYLDIKRFLSGLHHAEGSEPSTKDEDISTTENKVGDEGGEPHSIVWSSLLDHRLTNPQHYSFNRGRHASGFYLKLGAAGFCLGHLIHCGLLVAYQITFLVTDSTRFYECARVTTLVLDFLYPTYSFLQLYFIFKYSNVRINRFKVLGRFALMHCIGSSLCFWIWTILRETKDSFHGLRDLTAKRSSHGHHLTNHTYDITDENVPKSNNSCQEPKRIRMIFDNFSPYLYPFTIEYSILVAGVLFVMWQNIGSYDPFSLMDRKDSFVSNVVLHADCHSSNKGIFAGLIIFAGVFLSIILFLVAMADRKYIEVGLTVNDVTELTLVILMTATVVLAYQKIAQLDINTTHATSLDSLMLFICVPAFFLHAVLSILPLWDSKRFLHMAKIILQAFQMLIQIPFIIDGLQRCSNSKSLRKEKPGRELLTLLIACNLAMWVVQTFEIKSHSVATDPRALYYGRVLWTSISHMTLPLMMFYRFHSSVCMVDIWKLAYVKGL